MTHAELAAAGFVVSAETYARLAAFVDALLAENEKLNLTAIREREAAWVLHVCDCLALLPLLRGFAGAGEQGSPARAQRLADPASSAPAESLKVLDLGSGGGVPGIPLACAAPDMQFTLLDATRKKLDAAERIIGAVGAGNVRTLWGRAELVGHDAAHRERYDVVVSRAVAKLPALVEWSAGLVCPGGLCCFMKSLEAVAPEVAAAESAARLCALRCDGYTDYELPGGHGRRVIVVYTKMRALRAKLPRPPGEAKKHAL